MTSETLQNQAGNKIFVVLMLFLLWRYRYELNLVLTNIYHGANVLKWHELNVFGKVLGFLRRWRLPIQLCLDKSIQKKIFWCGYSFCNQRWIENLWQDHGTMSRSDLSDRENDTSFCLISTVNCWETRSVHFERENDKWYLKLSCWSFKSCCSLTNFNASVFIASVFVQWWRRVVFLHGFDRWERGRERLAVQI